LQFFRYTRHLNPPPDPGYPAPLTFSPLSPKAPSRPAPLPADGARGVWSVRGGLYAECNSRDCRFRDLILGGDLSVDLEKIGVFQERFRRGGAGSGLRAADLLYSIVKVQAGRVGLASGCQADRPAPDGDDRRQVTIVSYGCLVAQLGRSDGDFGRQSRLFYEKCNHGCTFQTCVCRTQFLVLPSPTGTP